MVAPLHTTIELFISLHYWLLHYILISRCNIDKIFPLSFLITVNYNTLFLSIGRYKSVWFVSWWIKPCRCFKYLHNFYFSGAWNSYFMFESHPCWISVVQIPLLKTDDFNYLHRLHLQKFCCFLIDIVFNF